MSSASTPTLRLTPLTVDSDRTRGSLHFALLLTGAFFIVCLITVLLHEPWRDELQAWMLARDNPSPMRLFSELRFEGHPILWYIPLYLLNRLTHNPLAMQLLHVGIATTVVFVIARHAPFTRLQKVLFAFGYFPLFEYGAISRDYSVGVLLLFTACAIYRGIWTADDPLQPGSTNPRLTRRLVALGLVLALMVNANVYAFILAIAFCAMLAAGLILPPFGLRKPGITYQRVALLGGIVAVGMIISLLQLHPDPDSRFLEPGWKTHPNATMAAKALATIWKAYIPIPRPIHSFWNTNILYGRLAMLQPAGALAVLIVVVVMLRRRHLSLLFFAIGICGLLAFAYSKYLGYVRHGGHAYMLFIAALWLAGGAAGTSAGETKRTGHGFPIGPPAPTAGASPLAAAPVASPDWRTVLFTALLALHCLLGLGAAAMDWIYPFSMSRQVATYLQQNELGNEPVVGHVDYAISPLACWLGHDVYMIDSQRWGTYIRWTRQRYARDMSKPEERAFVFDEARRIANDKGREIILVLTPEPTGDGTGWIAPDVHQDGIKLLKVFQGAIQPDENYWLYTVTPAK